VRRKRIVRALPGIFGSLTGESSAVESRRIDQEGHTGKPGLISDTRGSTELIQFVLVLPVFVLILYGSFEIWKIVSVRQAMGAAAYQTARCRSIYNECRDVTSIQSPDVVIGGDNYRCEWVLLHELINNSFVDREDLRGAEIRYRDPRGDLLCVVFVDQHLRPFTYDAICPVDPTTLGRNAKFDVELAMFLPWPIIIPGLPTENPTMVVRHRGYIECGPRWRPTPTPTLPAP